MKLIYLAKGARSIQGKHNTSQKNLSKSYKKNIKTLQIKEKISRAKRHYLSPEYKTELAIANIEQGTSDLDATAHSIARSQLNL